MVNEKKVGRVRETSGTYGDYAGLPDGGNRYELVDGVLETMSSSVLSMVQLIIARIQFMLTQSCDRDFPILNAPIKGESRIDTSVVEVGKGWRIDCVKG